MPSSVFITGANRGVGLEFVRQYAQIKPDTPKYVFAACRSPDTAEDLKKLQQEYNNVVIVKLDLTDESTYGEVITQVTDKVGDDGLNLLINNAGAAARSGINDVTSQQMLDLYKINAVAPLLLTQAALNMITKNMSLDLKKDGIMATAIHPGWIKTDMGGPSATTATEDCVKTLIALISSFKDESSNGQFYHYSGRVMSW
ncbi:hypothetical protein ACF0H5_010090 [Mactra antiquata]